MNYQYKCVEMPLTVSLEKSGSNADVVRSIESTINAASQGGWEYVATDSVSSIRNNGCLGLLRGQAQTTTTVKVIIFRKQL